MKKLTAWLCITGMLLSWGAGCTPDSTQPQGAAEAPTGSESASTAQQGQPQGDINMRMAWWGGDARHKATLEAIGAYTAINPHVSIEGEYSSFEAYYTKLLTQLASDTAPDLVQVDYKWVRDLMGQREKFIDLNTVRDRIDMSMIDEGIIEAYCSMDGFMLGLPIGINAFSLMYNVQAVADMGIGLPEKPTWEDLVALGKEVQVLDPDKYLLIPQNGHYYMMFKSMMLQLTGNNLMSDEDNSLGFSAQDAAVFFTYLQELFETGTIPPIEETQAYGSNTNVDQIPSWHDGTYLMHTVGASTLPNLIESSGFEVDVVRWPVMEGAVDSGVFTPVSMMFSVNSNSPYVDQVVDFINWYSNDEEAITIMGTQRGVPVNQRAVEILQAQGTIKPQVQRCVDISLAGSGKPESALDTNAELETLFNTCWQSVGYGRMTPEEAAQQYISDLEKALASM